jgi:hypothetical protein
MWSSDGNCALEEWIRTAEQTPQPTHAFRQQVLGKALVARRRSESVQRIQVLTTVLLAASVLFFLPGYYSGVHHERHAAATTMVETADSYSYFSRTGLAAMAVAEPILSNDGFESSLIEAEFAMRAHSARAFGGAL